MPADRLTPPAEQVAAHVEAVLAGQPAGHVAAEAGINPVDLDDAVEAYRAAGRAALERRQDAEWFQARVQPREWATAEHLFAATIGPSLDQLSPGAWWYLRKHPCWRIRIRTTDHHAAGALLDGLVDRGLVAGWTPGVYEPETAAFGGPEGTAAVHALFCADSRALLAYSTLTPAPIGRRELSLLLIRAMQDRAGLDAYEIGDVFDRLARMRPAPEPEQQPQLDALAQQMLPLLTLHPNNRAALFAPDGPLHAAGGWMTAFETAGRQLGDTATSGRLDRGLRTTIAHVAIFHWNRLGLAAHSQGILARAAATALLPRN